MAVMDDTAEEIRVSTDRLMGRTALTAIAASISLAVLLGVQGPTTEASSSRIIAGPTFPAAPPWPPWFVHAHAEPLVLSIMLWLAELLGGAGLILALLAVRRGWRPRPQRLIVASVMAVIALMVIPPVDNGDPTMYAAFGRITVLGHSPYVMTPGELRSAGDPVGADVGSSYWKLPSRYGPVATITEAAASEVAGDSAARTIFWLKVWNALSYLALVLALDRAVRSNVVRRIRVHLLWSLNPLMLFAIMANGHNDVVAATAGVSALLVFRRINSLRGLFAGILLGLAAAIKAPYALFGLGLAWSARRSPRALTTVVLGAALALVPVYLFAGKAAIYATAGMRYLPPTGPWSDAAKVLGWEHEFVKTNTLGLITSAILAVLLLWGMPTGPRDIPAVRVALALALGLVIFSPQQAASYDAMIFPLLAVMPATRLDWVIVLRAIAMAEISTPYIIRSDPTWLTVVERIGTAGSPTLVLGAAVGALLLLCVTRAWNPSTSQDSPLVEGAPAIC